jgi:hypothetical protein
MKLKSTIQKSSFLKKTEDRKQEIIYIWPFSFTTTLISTFERPDKTRTIYLFDNNDDYKNISKEKQIIYNWGLTSGSNGNRAISIYRKYHIQF